MSWSFGLTLRSGVAKYQRFGGPYCLHLRDVTFMSRHGLSVCTLTSVICMRNIGYKFMHKKHYYPCNVIQLSSFKEKLHNTYFTVPSCRNLNKNTV